VAAIATLQRFTADNQYSEAMGPILYRNHYTAFIEVVLPLALYGSLRRKRDAPVYAVMAAAMYASVIVSASRSGLILTSTELRVVPAILWLRGWGLPFTAVLATLFLWRLRPVVVAVWGFGVVSVFLHATVDYPFSRPALAAWTVAMIALLATRPAPELD
jgi:hypothetical protein